MKKETLLVLLQLLLTLNGFGQTQSIRMKRMRDSLTAIYVDNLALKRPILRQAGVNFESFGDGSVRSKYNDNAFIKGKMQMTRLTAHFNIPVAHIGKNIMALTFAARQQRMDLKHVENLLPNTTFDNMDFEKNVVTTTFSLTRMDSVFNRPFTFTEATTFLVDPESGQWRTNFAGGFILTIKRTATSSISVGILGVLDPSSPLPVIPYIEYYKRLKNHKLEFFADPSRIALRKEISSRHFLWASNVIAGSLSLFEFQNSSLPENMVFATFEIKTGLMYEYRMNKKIILHLNAGMLSTLSSKLVESYFTTNPILENSHDPVPYVQFGISSLPFWKGFAK